MPPEATKGATISPASASKDSDGIRGGGLLLPRYWYAPRSHAPETGRTAPALSVPKTEERFSPDLMAGEPAPRCGSNEAEFESTNSGSAEIVAPCVYE